MTVLIFSESSKSSILSLFGKRISDKVLKHSMKSAIIIKCGVKKLQRIRVLPEKLNNHEWNRRFR